MAAPLVAAIRLGARGTARGLGAAGEAGTSTKSIGEVLGDKMETAVRNGTEDALRPIKDILKLTAAVITFLTFKLIKGIHDFITNPIKTIAGIVTDPIARFDENIGDLIDAIIPEEVQKSFEEAKDNVIDTAKAFIDAMGTTDPLADQVIKDLETMTGKSLSTFDKFAVKSLVFFKALSKDGEKEFEDMKTNSLSIFEKFKLKVIQVFQDILDFKKKAAEVVTTLSTRGKTLVEIGQIPTRVSDAIITKEGKIIQTDPEDDIIATKNLGSIGSTTTINFYGLTMDEAIEKVKIELGASGFTQGRF